MTLSCTKNQIKENIKNKLEYHFGVTPEKASYNQLFDASAIMISDMMNTQRMDFNRKVNKNGSKVVYYMSMEFLLGRSLKNNLFNLGLSDLFEKVIGELGFEPEQLYEQEPDAGLGNGGLGRLAACFMDSAASLGYPVTGYSILYEFGIFRQKIVDGWQAELPDFWLQGGDVWLEPRFDESVDVLFDGEVSEEWVDGSHSVNYTGCNSVTAVPYDMMISGYNSAGVCVLRLWSAKKPSFDIGLFNQGDYMKAIEQSSMAEVISKVLYPSDNHPEGKSLRLRQQYFLVSASIKDIIRKHFSKYNTITNLYEKVTIHINETHAALTIPELMRILLDDCGYGWDDAWNIVTKTVAYTNHTVMSEALEVWPEEMFKHRLPRIYEILTEINERFCRRLWDYYPGDFNKIAYMSVIAYGQIRMANLCNATCFSVNGVSKIHSEIIRTKLFADFGRTFPEKFTNVTNGIDHRRWLCQANPELSALIGDLIGPGFIKDSQQLERLRAFEDDKSVLFELARIKKHNKERLANYLGNLADVKLDPETLFDVQVKRLHEYKRQTLNALHILYLYNKLRENPGLDIRPQTFIFGAKAAPGYTMAKEIIRLICSIAKELDGDKQISEKLKVVFLEDYRVTLAEYIMPAAEISEQISLAGTEASGTGNMKLMINGAVTIGTLDGANVEMRDAVGDDNILIFGLKAEEIDAIRANGYRPTNIYHNNRAVMDVIDRLNGGIGGIAFKDIAASFIGSGNASADPYMVLADFTDYCRIHEQALERYSDTTGWNKMSLCNIAGAGRFSADRALTEYARNIWNIKPIRTTANI
jgi:starch phosphorylase